MIIQSLVRNKRALIAKFFRLSCQLFRGNLWHYSQEVLLEKVGVYQISNAYQ
ncbi:MAG: hypothetical protein O9326_15775 [Microcystis sp. LE19-338.1B]|jgi:hypothetical protein|nr:hypothetical protein [Microcystis sp. LE19-338.1B]MCZ8358557.1 hypothetical protein [Microcystis sp. LE19-388.1G]